MAAASDALVSCAHNPDFAAVCSFLEQFGDKFGIVFPSFYDLQQLIECTTQNSQVLIELHVKLLRRLKRSASMDRWENAIVKFAHTYSQQDAWELERFGYLKANLNVKIRLLKNLLETQFDKNPKFKAEINALSSQDLRLQPLGRDRHGYRYWHLLDDDCNLRVYREDMDDETWELVASDKTSMLKLIESLTSEANQITPLEATPEDSNSQDFLDTGQKSPPELTQETPVTNLVLSENDMNSNHDAAISLPPSETNISSEVTETSLNHDGPNPQEDRDVPAVLSGAVEAPLLVIRGEGSGADCDAGNPGQEEEESIPESQEGKEGEIRELERKEGGVVSSSSDSTRSEKEGSVTIEGEEHQVRVPKVEKLVEGSEESSGNVTTESEIQEKAKLEEDLRETSSAIPTEESRTGIELDNHGLAELNSVKLAQPDDKKEERENVMDTKHNVEPEKSSSIQMDDKEVKTENFLSTEQNSPAQESSDSLKSSARGELKEHKVQSNESSKDIAGKEDKKDLKNFFMTEEPKSTLKNCDTAANDRNLETGEGNSLLRDPENKGEEELNDCKCIGTNIVASEDLSPPHHTHTDEKTDVLSTCSQKADVKEEESVTEGTKDNAVGSPEQNIPLALVDQRIIPDTTTVQEKQIEIQKPEPKEKGCYTTVSEHSSQLEDSSAIPRSIKGESPMERNSDHMKEEKKDTAESTTVTAEQLRVPEQMEVLTSDKPQHRVKVEIAALGTADEEPDVIEPLRRSSKLSELSSPVQRSSIVEEVNLESNQQLVNSDSSPSQPKENLLDDQEAKTVAALEENLTKEESINPTKENDERSAPLSNTTHRETKNAELKQTVGEEYGALQENRESALDLKPNDTGTSASEETEMLNENSSLKHALTENPETLAFPQIALLGSRNSVTLAETSSSRDLPEDQKQDVQLPTVEVTEDVNMHESRTRDNDSCVNGQNEVRDCLDEKDSEKEEIKLNEKREPLLTTESVSEALNEHSKTEMSVHATKQTECVQQVESKVDSVLEENSIQGLSQTGIAISEIKLVDSTDRKVNSTTEITKSVQESQAIVLKTETSPVVPETSVKGFHATSDLFEGRSVKREALNECEDKNNVQPDEAVVKQEELNSQATYEHPVRMESNSVTGETVVKSPVVETNDNKEKVLNCEANQAGNWTKDTESKLGVFNSEELPSSVEPSKCEDENVAKEPLYLAHSPLLEPKPSESELEAPRAVVRRAEGDYQSKGQANVFISQDKSDNESQDYLDENQKPVQVAPSSEDKLVRETEVSFVRSITVEHERPSSCSEALPEMETSSSIVEEDSSKLVIVARETEASENRICSNQELIEESLLAPKKTKEQEFTHDGKNCEVLPGPEVEECEELSKERENFYETSSSSSNSLQIAAGESPPPSPKNEEGLNGPIEPYPGSVTSDENSKSNLIHKQEDSGPKTAPEEAPLLAALATPPNLEEDKSNLLPVPPFCRSPEIHSENATTDSKFQELVEKFHAVEDGDVATLSSNVPAAETSCKTSSSGITENSPSKGMSLTSFSMDYDGETVMPLQETLALLKQNEKRKEIEKEETSEERKEPVLQKRRGRKSTKRLTADALVMLNASEVAAKEATPRGCRQSLRIAKLKEKEDDERRAVEEERLQRLKVEFERRERRRQEREARKVRIEEKAKKKDQQGPKKKRKRSTEEDSDFSAGEKKTKKKKKKNTPWDSSDSSSESSSSEDDLEALQQAVEEEEELVFKSDHEFSPESDIGEDDAAPTRHARTARKKITKKKAEQVDEDEEAEDQEEEEDEEEVDESSCQKCGLGDNPEWILLCDNCDGGWHVSCLKPALMMIPASVWYCPPCEHAMLMEKLQERLEAYEYLLQQRDADIKAKEELEAAAKLAAAEEETDDLDRREEDEGEDLDEEEDKEDKGKKKKTKSDEDESAPEEGEEEEEDENESGEDEESAISEEKSEEEGEEPVYRLRDRKGSQQPAYNFKAYDEMIKSAIQDEDQEEEKSKETVDQKEGDKEAPPNAVPAVAPLPVSKGKGPRSDEDSDEDFSRLVRRKKKARKLNDLDATSSDDSKDTDFKGSSASDDEEDEWEAEEEDSDDDFIVDESDESDVVVFKGRDRRNAEPSIRRSTRKRAPRYKMDSDSDTSEESVGASWSSGGSSESSSDASWGGGRKRRKITKKPAPVKKPSVKKAPVPKKKSANTAQKRGRRKTQSDSDSNEESFKPRGKKTKATPRQEPEEDSAASRRTRGKKVSYRALISSEDSISEDEPPKRPPPERKSIRPPVATASVVAPPPVSQLAAPPSPSPSQADEDEDLHLSAAEAIAEEEAEAGRADSPWDDQDAVLPSSQTAASLPDDLDPSATSSSTGMGSDLPPPVPMDNAVIQHALSALATPPIVPPTIPVGLPMPVLTQTAPVHIPRTLDVQRMLHDPPAPASLSPKLNRMPPEMHVSRLIQQTPPTPVTAINPLALRNSLPPEGTSSLRKLDLLAASDLSKVRDDPHLKMEILHAVQGSRPYPVKPPALLVDPNPRSFMNVIKVPEPRVGTPSNRLPPVMPPLYTGSPKASPLPEGVIRPSPYIPPPPYSEEPRPYAAAPAPSSPHPSHVQPPSHPSSKFLPQPYPGYGPPRLSYAPPPPRPYPYPMHPYIRTPGFQHAGFPTAFATEEERRIFRVAQPPRDYVFERGDPTLSSAPSPAVAVLEEPEPKNTPPSSVANPGPSETEESEFGGLVSYFSSQQEDFDS